MSMAVVFDNVSYTYNDEDFALRDISLEIPETSMFGIVGHTGSGKSTLLQLMNALLPPSEGRVLVDGLDCSVRKSQHEIRSKVGLAFQYPERQLFARTVAEDLAFGPKNLGMGAEQAEQCSRDAMQAVGLDFDEFARRSPFRLSGGQQRRVALAGILAMRPSYLVLDEPAAGMDPASSVELLHLLRALNEEGLTVVMVSHSMDDVAALCSHVAVLESGKLILQGTPSEVFSRANAERLEEMGVGLPSATAFAQRLDSQGSLFTDLPMTTQELAEGIARALA